ncbi:sigma-70 family RNA polymerase sigma factor [Gillisia sp. M10.2A]|uniref:Sigma-70 family RNA polymerase sigma factor n=1 Tax=Gillisia lutea TaxID=2909668 RepID=A0ABS9EL31_9FLAO|nr:sigma-70 family RNA polymerase sigma factor [Gillisia lutea]MCF4102213.1 sigma-70 family RNA polymerase sigma factor [Gillisia lutea]
MASDQKTLKSFFDKHYKPLCALSYSYVKDFDQSQDIVQDVFLRIMEKGNYAAIDNFEAYLKTCVYHDSLRYLKEAKKKIELLEEEQAASLVWDASDTDQFDENDILLLFNEIRKLPPGVRKVFELCAIEGLKYSQAANQLELSVNTVKTQMKKAYSQLRKSSLNSRILLLFI